jgi:predicted RND superfamily exporter protein
MAEKEIHLPGDFLGKGIAKVISSSIKHPKGIVVAFVIITVFLGIGLKDLVFQTTFVDWLPASDPNTQAAEKVLGKELKGFEAMEMIFPKLDMEKAAKYGCTNITDAVGIRAQWEFFCYIQDKVPEVKLHWGLPHFINWMRAGAHTGVILGEKGRPTSEWYELPESDDEMAFYGAFLTTILTQAAPTAMPMLAGGPMGGETWPWFFMIIMYEPVPRKGYELVSSGSLEIADRIKAAIKDYQADCKAGLIEYDIFDFEDPNEYMGMMGLGSIMSHFTDVSISTAWLALPIVVVIIICLLIAFRNIHTMFVALIPLVVGAIWIIGGMGWLKIPIGAANIAFIPLILGDGIDYSLHSLGEYCIGKTKGLKDEDALIHMGKRAGIAISLATLTTVIGLLMMVFCESRAMVIMAISCALAIIICTLFAIIFIPALVMISKGARKAATAYAPAPWMGRAAKWVGTHKKTFVVILVIVTLGFGANIANLKFMVDPIGGLFPKDDYISQGYDFAMGIMGAQDPTSQLDLEVITLEAIDGNTLTYPEVIDYKYKLEDELRKSPRCILPILTGFFSFDWYIGEYRELRDGNLGFLATIATSLAEGRPMEGSCPKDDHELMEQYISEMMDDPYWEPFWPILMNEEHTFTFFPHLVIAHMTYEDSKAIRDEINQAIEAAEPYKPDYIRTNVVGLRSTMYTFLNYSMFYITLLFIASLIVLFVISRVFIGRWMAAAGITISAIINVVIWLGLLALFGIEVSIALVLPIVFITSLTSDYDIHIMWNTHKTGDPEYTYNTVGKAVFFSALTDGLAFYIFSFSYIKGFVAAPMLGVALAILCGFLVSLLVIPLFIKWEKPVKRKE